MNYDDFILEIKRRAQERLGRLYNVSLEKVIKNNGVIKDALCMGRKEVEVRPTLYLNAYYDMYQEYMTLDDIMDEILEVYEWNEGRPGITAGEFKDYDKVKERIIFKLINTEKNNTLLNNVPHIFFENLAVVFCVYKEHKGESLTSLIHSDLLVSGIVKQYITGDEVSAEIKGGETYTYSSKLKIIMALNQLPSNILDTTFAVKRRLLILPFSANFQGKKLDRNIGEKLKTEMSGIINRAIKGLERLEKNDYVFSYEDKSNSILNELFKESNPLHYFVDECIVLQEGYKFTYEDLLLSYGKWCKKNDVINQYGRSNFATVLKQILRYKNLPIISFSSNGKRGLRNLKCILK